jgi:hypothetical protein
MKVIICPQCGTMNIVRIVYGMVGPEMGDAEKRGEVKLGGCCITDNDPTHYCKDCEHRFTIKKKAKR